MNKAAAMLAALLLGLFGIGGTATAQAQSMVRATTTPTTSPGQGKVLLRIMVFAHAPVVGADVQVSVHRRLLVDAKAATNKYGVFAAPVWRAWLPDEETAEDTNARERHRRSSVRVTISGGTINGQPFPWHLMADIPIADLANQILVVNPVTTLVSRLLDVRPELDLNQAQARVRSFLTIPANYPLGQALRQGPHYRSRFFSPAVFVAEAEAAGGLDAFAHLLLLELASGLTHSFRPQDLPGTATSNLPGSTTSTATRAIQTGDLPGSTTSTATSVIQTGLEAGVLDYASSQDAGGMAGWAISLSGLSSGDSSNIDALEGEMQEIVALIQHLSFEVDQLTNVVQSTATQTQYDDITNFANQYAIPIQKHEGDLEYYSNKCPPLPAGSQPAPPDTTCPTLYQDLLDELKLEDENGYYELVQNYVQDNGTIGTSGILHLYSLWLAETRSFFRAADSTKMQNLYDYWDSILTSAANLRMEYYHLIGLQDGPAGQGKLTGFMGDPSKNPPTTGTFQVNEAANLKLMPRAVPDGTVVGIVPSTYSLVMWSLVPWQPDFYTKTPLGYSSVVYPAAGCYTFPWTDVTHLYLTSGEYYGIDEWGTIAFIDDWKAAVKNAPPGTDWQQWLIDQTKTTGDETPASPGFFNGNSCPHASWAYNPGASNPAWAIFPNGQSKFIQAQSPDKNLTWPVHGVTGNGEFYFYSK